MSKKRELKKPDELRTEYDLSKLGSGVRGKYYSSARARSNLVLIDPDLASVFPTAEAVNRALRALADAAAASSVPPRRRRA